MDTAEIRLPVSRAMAERWRAPRERARLGAVLSMAFAAGGTAEDAAAPPGERRRRLGEALAGLQSAAVGAGITPEEIEAELTAWKLERTAVRRR